MSRPVSSTARVDLPPRTSSTGRSSHGELPRAFTRSDATAGTGTGTERADGNRPGQWMRQHIGAPVRQALHFFHRDPASAGAAPRPQPQPQPRSQPPMQFIHSPLAPVPGLRVGDPPVRLPPPAVRIVGYNLNGPITREVIWPNARPSPIATPSASLRPDDKEEITYF